jgi:hypothetical protein
MVAESGATLELTRERAHAIMVAVAAHDAWGQLEADLWAEVAPQLEGRMKVLLKDIVSAWARGEPWPGTVEGLLARLCVKLLVDLPEQMQTVLMRPAYDLFAIEGTPPHG